MQSTWLVRAAPLCAALLILKGDSAYSFMVARRSSLNGAPSVDLQSDNVVSRLHDTDAKNRQLQAPLFSASDSEKASFVESSSDDDDDDDEKDREGGEASHKSHESHESHESADKGKHEESSKETGGENHDKGESKEKKEGDKGKDEKKSKLSKEAKEQKARAEHTKHQNLLTSPEEQSIYIRRSMDKASAQSYKAMTRLIKVMDSLNAVVALLDQIVHLAPPSPPFSQTVIIESAGKKLSLKGLLDEAATVRSQVDSLFTMLMSAKHAIIGSINRAIPARPPGPPAAAK